jgi:hypothetical protein
MQQPLRYETTEPSEFIGTMDCLNSNVKVVPDSTYPLECLYFSITTIKINHETMAVN